MVENFRLEKGKSAALEYRYYISSKKLSAEQAAMAVREHWGIESMHWAEESIMPTSYEFKYAPRRANQAKHCTMFTYRFGLSTKTTLNLNVG